MKSLLVVALGIVVIASCLALDCPDCKKELCKDPGPCKYGQTLDVCACCSACYKGPGEQCGGPWDVFGFCAKHLTCVKLGNPKDPIQEFNAAGTCLALPK